MKLVFNLRGGAVAMSPDTEGLGAAVVAGVVRNLTSHSSQWYFVFLPIYIYIYIYVCVCVYVYVCVCDCLCGDKNIAVAEIYCINHRCYQFTAMVTFTQEVRYCTIYTRCK